MLESAAGASAVASGGIYHEGGQEIVIRAVGRARRADEIGRTVVAVRAGTPILLSDVARIEEGAAPRFGTASVNAEPAVVLSIQKQPDVNTLELTRRIDAELEAIAEQLPEGMQIDSGIFRQADFIEHAVDNVEEALVLGAILVVVILFLFLWNVRTTAISLLAIPLSLAAAVLVLRMLGDTLNTMTLGGLAIAIGALVDDAIIDVENTFRRLRERLRLPEDRRLPMLETVYEAAREVLAPMVNATLIIVIVFVPLFFLSGVEGRMLRPLGFAYIISILASLLVALTVTPVLCSYLLRPGVLRAEREEPSALVRWLKRHYDRALVATLDRPRPILVGSAATAAAALVVFFFLGRGFLPEFQEGTLTISAVTLPGTSIETTDMLGERI
ncbi:MAG: efflux RND transporter permease subunit, partial [Actinobacteria bacterium]|nr:efflux RND transporter permease subunit [Actinomycetota bacterium]